MKRALAALALLAAACSPPGDDSPRWCMRNVRVFVSDELPANKLLALGEAVRFWESQGIDYLKVVLVSDETIYLHAWGIRVLNEPARGDNTLGTATTKEGPRGCIKRSTIRLSSDSAEVVAHELGHAMGLEHNTEDRNNVMYPYSYWDLEQWGVTDEQLEQIL